MSSYEDEKLFSEFKKYMAAKKQVPPKREYSRSRSRSPKNRKRSHSKSPVKIRKHHKKLAQKEAEILELKSHLRHAENEMERWKQRAKEDDRELSNVYSRISAMLFGENVVCLSLEALVSKISKLYRTQMCRYSWGECPVGSHCRFIHLSRERLEKALKDCERCERIETNSSPIEYLENIARGAQARTNPHATQTYDSK